MAWGGPGFEVIIDGRPVELQFNKPAREIVIGAGTHFIYVGGEAPDVKICGKLPSEFYKDVKPTVIMDSTPSNHQLQMSGGTPVIEGLSEMIARLKEYNILPPSQQHQQQQQQQPNQRPNEKAKETSPKPADPIESVPDLTNFETSLLKQKYPGAIQSLYSGIQCATCGNRFNQHTDINSVSSNSSRYSKHLDWHFRQNKREKEEINKAQTRAWYYKLSEWIQYEEISEDQSINMDVDVANANSNNQQTTSAPSSSSKEHNENEFSDEDEEIVKSVEQKIASLSSALSLSSSNKYTNMLNGVPICAATNDIDDNCFICKEPFEIFYYDEKEEFYFQEAIRVRDRVYHPICYEDADEV